LRSQSTRSAKLKKFTSHSFKRRDGFPIRAPGFQLPGRAAKVPMAGVNTAKLPEAGQPIWKRDVRASGPKADAAELHAGFAVGAAVAPLPGEKGTPTIETNTRAASIIPRRP